MASSPSMADQHDVNTWTEDEITQLIIPKCDRDLIPRIGQAFRTLEEEVQFYYKYANTCGFGTRLSYRKKAEDGTITHRHIVCNRAGLKSDSKSSSSKKSMKPKKKRKTVSTRVDCMARIVFRLEAVVGYVVHDFYEEHTHHMVPASKRHLMKSRRNVGYVHQMFLLCGMKANIGPMRTFRFFKEIVGNYDDVGYTSIDFKNYARDLRVHTEGVDAKILLDNLKKKQEKSQGFKYYFETDEEAQLKRMFWSDEMSIQNYHRFGDAVSFDATYSTNRYKLIFTPFTGKDNHGRCVTFGAALISNEDVDSYTWVLNKFVECMGSHPLVFITDQDPAMKIAIENVLPNTSHRLCMWHILMKVVEKLPRHLRDNTELKERFNNIVWSDLVEPHEFEQNWHRFIEEYDLFESRWFTDMFHRRANWVSSYFRDVKMSGLFRTTSMSESENSFFRRHFNKDANVVQLFMHYESAMDAQRTSYDTITMADETSSFDMCTDLRIEVHASNIYTNKIFKDEIQPEIVAAAVSCLMARMYDEGNLSYYEVDDRVHGVFKVCYSSIDDHFSCSCKLFIRKGWLCKHIFFVMRTRKLNKIPEKYIIARWTKLSQMSQTPHEQNVPEPVVVKDDLPIQKFFLEVCKSFGHVRGDSSLSQQLYNDLKGITDKYSKLGVPFDSMSKHAMFEEFYGVPKPTEVDVLPPPVVHTKGSGCGGRRKSTREKMIEQALKPKRRCRKCNQMVNHDSRNCPGKDVTDDSVDV
ncbi:protein FAR1-RELATED SEQUENCE 5-like [Salvia miltiorrhiza]|uniref:protein FAR1-RELATED SEQUENCE 5-like n=1 Tax=Salvia miltiorrhiza TaxID=226208 RepID=UPI0025AD2D4B|nr:protein FAR1-RELATED SEQUENCE 5-like [Salvia miltiorrhiza]